MPADHPDLDAVAREVLDSSFYMTLGTADADGRPWVSPVFFAADRYRDFYRLSSWPGAWRSTRESGGCAPEPGPSRPSRCGRRPATASTGPS